MSRSRRAILVIAGCLLFLTVLVPPWFWVVNRDSGFSGVSAGYGLLFAPPSRQQSWGDGTFYTSTAQAIDLSRLGLQALLIVLGAGVAWFAIPQKPPTN